MNTEKPIYISPPCKDSWGHEYRIYSDRVELPFKLFFMTFRIPFEEIAIIDVVSYTNMSKSERKKFPPLAFFWVLNFDRAPFRKHVLLVRKNCSWKHRYYHFTPQDPQGFVVACRMQMSLIEEGRTSDR